MSGNSLEFIRYIINGIFATSLHYAILIYNLHVLSFQSAGLANLIASFFGIVTSFIGSRYFVFPATSGSVANQAAKFSGLYLTFAALHGASLFLWVDLWGYDYRIGFVIATAFQVAGSYIGNKFLVFKNGT